MDRKLYLLALIVLCIVLSSACDGVGRLAIPGKDIPVTVDVGYWVEVVNRDEQLKLQPKDAWTYEGCMELIVTCNFACRLNCAIKPTGVINGKFTCSLKNAEINAPGGTSTLCVGLQQADISTQLGGSKNVHVASVTISVTPRSL